MAKKLGISFKETVKDQELYDYFFKMQDRSNEMKAILKEWYEKNVKKLGPDICEKEKFKNRYK